MLPNTGFLALATGRTRPESSSSASLLMGKTGITSLLPDMFPPPHTDLMPLLSSSLTLSDSLWIARSASSSVARKDVNRMSIKRNKV